MKKKQIAILGSTGSIGTQALQVIECPNDLFRYILKFGKTIFSILRIHEQHKIVSHLPHRKKQRLYGNFQKMRINTTIIEANN